MYGSPFWRRRWTDIGGVNFALASRITAPARDGIVASCGVFHIAWIVGATTTQPADFPTLQLINNTDGESSDGTICSSILSLFTRADPTLAPASMSAFDRGLLAGLYVKPGRVLHAPVQRGRIAGEKNKRD